MDKTVPILLVNERVRAGEGGAPSPGSLLFLRNGRYVCIYVWLDKGPAGPLKRGWEPRRPPVAAWPPPRVGAFPLLLIQTHYSCAMYQTCRCSAWSTSALINYPYASRGASKTTYFFPLFINITYYNYLQCAVPVQ